MLFLRTPRRLCVPLSHRVVLPPTAFAPVETGTRFDAAWSMKFRVAPAPALATAPTSPVATPTVQRVADYHALAGRAASAWHNLDLRWWGEGTNACPAQPQLAQPTPLVPGTLLTYVNEIPKGTRPKLELKATEAGTPIVQDVKKGKLRLFTYGDLPFNYGFFPRTLEDPSLVDPHTGCKGDGDPVDVVELSDEPLSIGAVRPVRALGLLALIDEGETDWKVIAVAAASPWRTLDDVPSEHLEAVRRWFREYKTTDGKPLNEFAFGGAFKDEAMALEVIGECAAQYDAVCAGTSASAAKYWVPSE